MSILISFGKWGGVYFHRGYSWRLCMGWIAVSVFPMDDDVLLDALEKGLERNV